MKSITIITFQNVRNYGSVLQALATQEVMSLLGLDCYFINYWKNHSDRISKRLDNWTKGRSLLVKLLMQCILYPSFKKDSRIFDNFNKKHLNLLPEIYTCWEDFMSFPIKGDIFCTGSDQTWNSGWNNGILPELFLKFVPDGAKKISYAASIGKDKLDNWEVDETKKLLSRYDAISVREKSAVKICEELGLPATHVLDPTLQVNKDFWLKIASPRLIKERYVLIYQLNTNYEFDKYAVEYAKRRGSKLVRLCLRHYQALRPGKSLIIPTPEEFISAIAYADTVITDSFHATAFSCNLYTPMICIYPNDYSSRLASLLKLVGLENRHLTDYEDFSFVENTEIDFASVNRILEEQRQIGWDFLKEAIK